MHESCLACGKFCHSLIDLTYSQCTPMDTESLSSSEGMNSTRANEIGAPTNDSNDFETYGIVRTAPEPPETRIAEVE